MANQNPIPTNDGVIIAQSMLDFLNSWPERPVRFFLDELNEEKESLMLQPLASAQKSRTYVNGSYMGQWSFAVYYRIKNSDTRDKINARKTLELLNEWLCEKYSNGAFVNLPVLTGKNIATEITLESTPSLAERLDNGVEDYQAIFNLSYYHKEV